MAGLKFQTGALVVVNDKCSIDVRGRQGVVKKLDWARERVVYGVEFKDNKSPIFRYFISSQLDPYNPFSREAKAASFIDCAHAPGCEGIRVDANVGSTSWVGEATSRAMKSLI